MSLHREVTDSLLLFISNHTYLTFPLYLLVSAGAIDESTKWRNGKDNTRTASGLGKGNLVFLILFSISDVIIEFLGQFHSAFQFCHIAKSDLILFLSPPTFTHRYFLNFNIICNETRGAHLLLGLTSCFICILVKVVPSTKLNPLHIEVNNYC